MPLEPEFYVHAERRDFGRNIAIYIIQRGYGRGPDRLIQQADNGGYSLIELTEGGRLPEKGTIEISDRVVPSLIETLLEVTGKKRPDESEMRGRLEATQAHLKDMRSLVFKIHPDNAE